MFPLILSSLALINVAFLKPEAIISPLAGSDFGEPKEEILASIPMDLSKRYDDEFVNEVFKDNIVLALYYLNNQERQEYFAPGAEVDWEKVRQLFRVSFTLQPGEVFAFHDKVLPSYAKTTEGKPIKTMGSHFVGQEGYRSDGLLYGDGVCHLASLINWAASHAKLEANSLVDHDFKLIFGIPKEFGTSINSYSARQNLYIKNTLDNPVEFRFKVSEEKVELEIIKK